jgi:hypothetical protein
MHTHHTQAHTQAHTQTHTDTHRHPQAPTHRHPQAHPQAHTHRHPQAHAKGTDVCVCVCWYRGDGFGMKDVTMFGFLLGLDLGQVLLESAPTRAREGKGGGGVGERREKNKKNQSKPH